MIASMKNFKRVSYIGIRYIIEVQQLLIYITLKSRTNPFFLLINIASKYCLKIDKHDLI